MIGKTNARLKIDNTVTVEPFSYYATHLSELGPVLDAHYAGQIDLSTLWSVGDKMENISLGAISASSLGGDSQSAQNIDLVILDFNHDTLSSDTSKKAAVTVGQLDSLATTGTFYSSYSGASYTRYTQSARRTWLNSDYYNALPSDLKSLIKPVQKSSCYSSGSTGGQQLDTTSETCWLASTYEIFGTDIPSGWSSGTTAVDGTQYPYYTTQSNRIKKQGKTGSASGWWSRSGFLSSNGYAYFVSCRSDGSQSGSLPTVSNGLAPCFAL